MTGETRRRIIPSQETTQGHQPLITNQNLPYYKYLGRMNSSTLWKTPYSSLLSPSITRCDTPKGPPSQHDNDKNESCAACLYTGMATCTGLSLYFFKMAVLEMPEEGTAAFTRQTQTNKRFLLACGTFWAAAGVYRWHLG